eukprot:5429020-Alexandrium_andersonii.AAC.1
MGSLGARAGSHEGEGARRGCKDLLLGPAPPRGLPQGAGRQDGAAELQRAAPLCQAPLGP